METLYQWRAHQKENLAEDKILNIALRVLEYINEWDELSPYCIEIEERDEGDVWVDRYSDTKEVVEEHKKYLEGMKGVIDAFQHKNVERRWLQFAFLLYYLAAGEITDDQFDTWTVQMDTIEKLLFHAVGKDTQYKSVGKLFEKILDNNRKESMDSSTITRYIIEQYKPCYKIECYSAITKNAITDMEPIFAEYNGQEKKDAEIIMDETKEVPYFRICFNRIPQLQQSENYSIAEHERSVKYVVSAEKQKCECFLYPVNWKEYKECDIDEAPDHTKLKPRETTELLEAYFKIYAEPKRYLLIYADYNEQSVIAYFDNRLLKRNQIKQWNCEKNMMQEELKDEIAYLQLKDEEIDSICLAASNKESGEELIKSIWGLYGEDKTKDIRFTQSNELLSYAKYYRSEMYRQLYCYYDLCFWSKDVQGKDMLHGVMEKQKVAECEFIRQIGQTEQNKISLVFYYVTDMENCTFSYAYGKRKAFTVSVCIGQYQGKLRVKCKRDAEGRYEVKVYTDEGEEVETEMVYA